MNKINFFAWTIAAGSVTGIFLSLPSHDPVITSAPQLPQSQSYKPENLSILFSGKIKTERQQESPQTNLIILGITYSDIDKKSFATISHQNKIFIQKIGSNLPDGSTLIGIEKNYIEIIKNEIKHTLKIKKG